MDLYHIKKRQPQELNWWERVHNLKPSEFYVEKSNVRLGRFVVGGDLNLKIQDIFEIHEVIKNQETFKFYNSKTKEYYERNTPTNTFRLRKRKGGFREITVFSEEYKRMHDLIYDVLVKLMPNFPDTTSAYIKGKSQLETVNKHKNANAHLSLDLENFYPSIRTETLEKVLKTLAPFRANLTNDSIHKLALISTHGGCLSQGSSISPILSNIFSIPLDHELYVRYLNTNVVYTRYADDISLSSPNVIALPRKSELNDFVNEIQTRLDILYDGNLKINRSKTKLQFNNQIKVLGICIQKDAEGNHYTTVGKTRKQEYSRDLFNFLCDIHDNVNLEGKLLEYQTVRGKIEYLKQFEPQWFRKQEAKLRTTFGFTGDVWSHILSIITTE